MKILIVEDDRDTRECLGSILARAGHEVAEAADGMEGWARFKEGTFHVILSDWMMPQLDGVDLCRMIRSLARDTYTYIIMLTAASGAERVIEALDAGADDFMTKPPDRGVLAARLRVAERILSLRAHVTRLEGLLSICSFCKQIRGDDGSWVAVDRYVQDRSALKFSHGVCPPCRDKHYPSVAARATKE